MDVVGLMRLQGDGLITLVESDDLGVPTGARFTLEPTSPLLIALRRDEPCVIEDLDDDPVYQSEPIREFGLRSEPIDSLLELHARLERDTELGALDSRAFAAVLLDGFMTSYLELSDELDATVDRLDEEALLSDGRMDLLGEMVALRHRIGAARQRVVLLRAGAPIPEGRFRQKTPFETISRPTHP